MKMKRKITRSRKPKKDAFKPDLLHKFKTFRSAIGHEFKKARENAGLTQLQLGKMCGWKDAQFVSNVERGIALYPIDTLLLIAQKTDMEIDSIQSDYVRLYELDFEARLQRGERLVE